MAYIRTGITMVGMALFIYKFIKLELIYEVLVILLLMVPGVGVIAYGIYKTVVHRKEKKKLRVNAREQHRRFLGCRNKRRSVIEF